MTVRRAACLFQLSPNPETGIWCSTCATPARVRFRVVALTDHGVTDQGTVEGCLRCDGYEDNL
jgi:hypothetical protein